MSDTPSPDIPDPASPTPATPEPAKPRRVITRPDTMVGTRLPGTKVVTRPDALTARLPGTYAANYGSDPNWKRGVSVLWVLFGLAAAAEFLRAVFIVWSSSRILPVDPATGWLVETGRVVVEAVIFLLLWVGWSWPRWVLVAVDFLFGAFFLITAIAPLPTPPGTLPVTGLVTLPQMALGVIYLVTAAYLAFSADVIGFTRHRREEGRGWVVLPVALIAGACAFVICAVRPYCQHLFQQWKPGATRFATESLRDMAQNWDAKTYEQRADPEYLKVWTPEQRKMTFGTLAGLGPSANLPEATLADEPKASVARSGGSFQVNYPCDFGKLRFAHGSASFGCIVSRHIFGPWQLENLIISEPEFDPEPPAAPTPAAPATVTPMPTVPPAP